MGDIYTLMKSVYFFLFLESSKCCILQRQNTVQALLKPLTHSEVPSPREHVKEMGF